MLPDYYRFDVFQTSGNPSLSIFTLLEPYDALVHHTLNLNGIYTGGKRNTLPFEEKNLSDKLRNKKISQSKTSTLFLH